MADILKRISQLNKEKKPEDKSLLEELFPQAAPPEPSPEETGITNLGTVGDPNLKMASDGRPSGFQEVSMGGPTAPSSPPGPGDQDQPGTRDNIFAGMREFSLEALGPAPAEATPEVPVAEMPPDDVKELSLDAFGATAEASFGGVTGGPLDPRAEERQRYIQLVAAFLKEGHYEAAINMIREMRQQLGKPG